MTKKLIQIKLRFSDKVLFEGRYKSIKECVGDAKSKGADLRGAEIKISQQAEIIKSLGIIIEE